MTRKSTRKSSFRKRRTMRGGDKCLTEQNEQRDNCYFNNEDGNLYYMENGVEHLGQELPNKFNVVPMPPKRSNAMVFTADPVCPIIDKKSFFGMFGSSATDMLKTYSSNMLTFLNGNYVNAPSGNDLELIKAEFRALSNMSINSSQAYSAAVSQLQTVGSILDKYQTFVCKDVNGSSLTLSQLHANFVSKFETAAGKYAVPPPPVPASSSVPSAPLKRQNAIILADEVDNILLGNRTIDQCQPCPVAKGTFDFAGGSSRKSSRASYRTSSRAYKMVGGIITIPKIANDNDFNRWKKETFQQIHGIKNTIDASFYGEIEKTFANLDATKTTINSIEELQKYMDAHYMEFNGSDIMTMIQLANIEYKKFVNSRVSNTPILYCPPCAAPASSSRWSTLRNWMPSMSWFGRKGGSRTRKSRKSNRKHK